MFSMASKPASSTPIPLWNHDVFLSFRGEDTRYNFTDHLYAALVHRCIRTFRDDKIQRGEEIAPELLKAIEESRLSIVVFSENYSRSHWCLNELVKIMECRKEMGQLVVPIFYHVDPSHVRKHIGSFGEAFLNYGKDMKEKVQGWKMALTEASNISGEHVKDGYESEYIKKIAKYIFSRLNTGLLYVEKNLIGMDSHLEEMTSRLCIRSNDVRIVGISGCGGIGKTTIAKVVYNQISYQYEGASFLSNVREASQDHHHGVLKLQKQLLDDIVVGENHNISNIDQGKKMIENKLCFKRILIVLDDVDHQRQLESLVGSREWFGLGSRVIITTRDKHLLAFHGANDYHVKELNFKDAVELFSWNAFKQDHPKEEYTNLSKCVVDYAKGHPLALKILGSFLFNKTIPEWKSELCKLEKMPNMEVQDVLKLSFHGLDRLQKKIFLDIACFFKGQDRDFVSRILDGCDFYGASGIRVLYDKCLITIVNNELHMHDMMQQMGWEIVREECPEDPSKWSRLWDPGDIYHAFTRKQGIKKVEVISLNLSKSKKIQFTTKAFKMMEKLRLIKIYWGHHHPLMEKDYKVLIHKGFKFPSSELRYFHWDGYYLESLPSNFYGENLVELYLKNSNIKQFWRGSKGLEKLKVIDVSHSKRLKKMSKFSNIPNLERLTLEGCTNLRKVHQSLGAMKKLTFLNMRNCKKLKRFPTSIELKSLEIFDLSGCSNFEQFPEIHENMEHLRVLRLNKTAIKELPSSIGFLESLEFLNLSDCANFDKFPEIRTPMKRLRTLNLNKTAIRELPSSIENLESLEILHLSGCSNFQKFPETERQMRLRELRLSWTAIEELPSSLGSVEILNLCGCSSFNFERFCEVQGNMKHLRELDLSWTAIEELPQNIDHLESLEILDLSYCSPIDKLPCPLNIEGSTRRIASTTGIKALPTNICRLKFLRELRLSGCSNLETFPEIMRKMENLRKLSLDKTAIRELPSSIQHLSGLEYLDLSNCKNLVTLSNTICELRSLEFLDVTGCSLKEGAIPAGISQLSKLRFLHVNHCKILEGLPELPSSLREIDAHDCPWLETLSSSSSLLWSSLLKCFKSYTEDLQCSIYSSKYEEIGIIIPGSSGIPEWISHQNLGSEIKIELPMNWYEDNDFLGLALCSLYHPPDESNNGNHCCLRCQLSFSGAQFQFVDYCSFQSWCECYKHGGIPDQVWVTYYPKIAVQKEYQPNKWRHLRASFGGDNSFVPEIKKCGVHFIYNQCHQENHTPRLLDLATISDDHGCAVEDTAHSTKRSHDNAENNPAEDSHCKRLRRPQQ